MSANEPEQITDAQFQEKVLEGKGITVVDFWAPWCGPCHSMAPGLASFAEANADRVNVYKLDVDDNPKTAEKYKIRSIPTIIFFREGEVVDTTVGALSESGLQGKLDAIL
ncbi:thioredoxin [Thermodesulfobacteriota bacterium]